MRHDDAVGVVKFDDEATVSGLKAPEMLPVNGQRVTIDASVKEATFFTVTDTSKEDVISKRAAASLA